MSEVISKIVEDNRMISMESVIDNLSAFLIKAPEKGVPFTELVFENPNKKLDIYFSVYYLSLIEDLFEEKNRFAKNIIENHENLIPSLQRFVNQLDEKNIVSIIEKASKAKNLEIFESAIYEIATYYPDLLRKYKTNLEESVKKGLLPGSNKEVLKDLIQKYDKAHKSTHLNDIALIRTDEALEAMFAILEDATPKEKLETKYRTKPESPCPTRLNQVFPSKATDAKNLIPHETNCKTESHQISSYRAPDSTRTTQPLTPTKSQSPTTATNSLNDAIVSLEFPLN
jgi:hypothetical protein